ncbi:MAG TPA: nitrilase-related carbon-nitrogen hydrolase, partial [Pseudomonadales bacterium]|nr:nitrilase-related carbon-nitrogen hydrolase [Pseudomonadales bacterium]
MSHRIALVQLVSGRDVEPNLDRVESLVRDAAAQHVSAIFLPENFAALANPDPRAIGEAEATGGRIRTAVAALARKTGCWIFAGTMPLAVRPDGRDVPAGRVRAASLVFDGEGREVARYDKIHMFDVNVDDNQRHYVESDTFEPGTDLVCCESPIGKVGLTVCYDIRFPEMYRRLYDQGVRSLTIPSAFTRVTGAAHFEVLMRARAVENFSFAIAACQGGIHDSGRETY